MLGGASGFNELQRGLPGISRRSSPTGFACSSGPGDVARRTGPKGRDVGLSPDARRPGPGGGRAGDRRAGGDLVVHRSPPRGARPRSLDRLDGPPRRSRAASPGSHGGPVRLPRPGEALLDGARALRGLGLPPAPRVRRRPSWSRSTPRPSTASTWARRAGRRAPGRQADDERPEGASARVRRWFAWAPSHRPAGRADERRRAASRLRAPRGCGSTSRARRTSETPTSGPRGPPRAGAGRAPCSRGRCRCRPCPEPRG